MLLLGISTTSRMGAGDSKLVMDGPTESQHCVEACFGGMPKSKLGSKATPDLHGRTDEDTALMLAWAISST